MRTHSTAETDTSPHACGVSEAISMYSAKKVLHDYEQQEQNIQIVIKLT